MPQTQSIIIYRNPYEQQFWESGMIVPLGVSLIVFFVVFLGMSRVLQFVLVNVKVAHNNIGWQRRDKLATYISMAIAFIAFLTTVYWMI